MKIAVLDDWQENAHEFADWSRVPGSISWISIMTRSPALPLFERLQEYDVICLMRERTLFQQK